MADFQFYVIAGLLIANLVATLLVQRMLYNHHEQTADDGGDEGGDGVYDS